MNYQHTQKGQGAALIVGVIAVAALVIGWLAFNRSGEDLGDVVIDQAQNAAQEAQDAASNAAQDIEDTANQAAQEAQRGLNQAAEGLSTDDVRTEAREDLEELQEQLQQNPDYEAAALRLSEIEADLAVAYENATEVEQVQFTELQEQFDEAEAALSQGSDQSLDYIGGLIDNLGSNTQVGE